MIDPKLLPLSNKVLTSRRGDYQLNVMTENPIIWTPEALGTTRRDLGVMSEIDFALKHKLDQHEYWQDEPKEFIDEYTKLYNELFGLAWLKKSADRHNIVVNPACCMTLVQYHDGVLTAYSRSTDMRNGFYSDKKVLDYLATTINNTRPDCKVEKIVWYLACPHTYVNKGIARLTSR